MKKLFGTDGIRGKANSYPITPEIALQLGKAIACHFGNNNNNEERLKAVVGKDTRLSGYMLETALTSGLVSMGMDVLQIGPMPTPAVAHLIKSMGADCGIMLTASHNPADDNGIKIFDCNGFKLPDSVEEKIETMVLSGEINSEHICTSLIGKAYRIDDAKGRYIEYAKSVIKNRSLKGLKIVLDCANGAAYNIAPAIFRELGAEVITMATEPDGFNINEKCGAMHPEYAGDLVKMLNADCGISFDGDADRVIFTDCYGKVVNGDRIIGLCAIDAKENSKLTNNAVVVTSMSNLGFFKAMEAVGIKTEITDVGDRYVIENMRKNNHSIGGEQSGHIIFMNYGTTGDGIISALNVLKIMLDKQQPLHELASFMTEYPQEIKSINVNSKPVISTVQPLVDTIKKCEKALGDSGRVIVRYSGTENKIRVLLEAATQNDINTWMENFSEVIAKNLT